MTPQADVREIDSSYGLLAVAVMAITAILMWGPRAPLGWALLLHGVAYSAAAGLFLRERRRHRLSHRAVFGAGGVLLLAAVVVPPVQSHDAGRT